MSRSRKLGIYKDQTGRGTKNYRRAVRRVQKQYVHKLLSDDETIIPERNEICNQYDYCDYKWMGEFYRKSDDLTKKLRRK